MEDDANNFNITLIKLTLSLNDRFGYVFGICLLIYVLSNLTGRLIEQRKWVIVRGAVERMEIVNGRRGESLYRVVVSFRNLEGGTSELFFRGLSRIRWRNLGDQIDIGIDPSNGTAHILTFDERFFDLLPFTVFGAALIVLVKTGNL